jgi:dienelactone hydrolase
MRATAVALLAALAAALPAVALAQQRVEFSAAPFSSSPAPLIGYVYEPRDAGPHPAVVMMHGCAGPYARDGQLGANPRMWAEYLAARGYVALVVDSFTSRGVKEVCTRKPSETPVRSRDRVGDTYAALAYLRARRDVDGWHVALMGWSHGGSTVLETIGRAPSSGAGFDAAIAFYPGCSPQARAPDLFHPYAPLLVLMGESDDWTPVRPCHELDAIVSRRNEPMQLVTYPGTYHAFDSPALRKPLVRKDVPNGVHPGQGVTMAPNPEAREDAKRRVADFLSRTLSKDASAVRR